MDSAGSHNAQCDGLKSPGFLELTVSIVILLGLFVSYLPQHYRIISRGTSEGISPYFVLLGVTSATSGFANILTVSGSRSAISCCKELDTFQCTAGLLGIAQLGLQWLCFAFILVLFLVFFRYSAGADDGAQEEPTEEAPSWRTAVVVACLCLLHAFIIIFLTGVFVMAMPNRLDLWATLLGLMGAALAAVQYIPQIWTTYRLKHVGSLSIPMMCIQTPGGLLFAASLFARLGWAGWSTWFIYIMTAFMQGSLLFMGIYYEISARKHDHQHSGHLSSGPHSPIEHTQPNRPQAYRTYSEGWERGLPGPFTGHPERYAETEEDLDDIVEREERAIARENQPLLKPGGIGTPYKSWDSNHD